MQRGFSKTPKTPKVRMQSATPCSTGGVRSNQDVDWSNVNNILQKVLPEMDVSKEQFKNPKPEFTFIFLFKIASKFKMLIENAIADEQVSISVYEKSNIPQLIFELNMYLRNVSSTMRLGVLDVIEPSVRTTLFFKFLTSLLDKYMSYTMAFTEASNRMRKKLMLLKQQKEETGRLKHENNILTADSQKYEDGIVKFDKKILEIQQLISHQVILNNELIDRRCGLEEFTTQKEILKSRLNQLQSLKSSAAECSKFAEDSKNMNEQYLIETKSYAEVQKTTESKKEESKVLQKVYDKLQQEKKLVDNICHITAEFQNRGNKMNHIITETMKMREMITIQNTNLSNLKSQESQFRSAYEERKLHWHEEITDNVQLIDGVNQRLSLVLKSTETSERNITMVRKEMKSTVDESRKIERLIAEEMRSVESEYSEIVDIFKTIYEKVNK